MNAKSALTLRWQEFSSLADARSAFRDAPCVYVQSDRKRRPIRVGKASGGLWGRYYGGTAYAMDAAMHRSGNRIFVAAVPADLLAVVESSLIWEHRSLLVYNKIGKLRPPPVSIALRHTGTKPDGW